MKHTRFLAAILGAAGIVGVPITSAVANAAPQRGQESQRREYHFRQEDAPKLRQNYKDIGHVDAAHRTMHHDRYVAGGHLPDDWRKHIHPVPAALIRELPPVPAGCTIGYIDGYCVVYDPGTLEIIDVIDLSS
jgi:Ni/Co efflux regulator RcnB